MFSNLNHCSKYSSDSYLSTSQMGSFELAAEALPFSLKSSSPKAFEWDRLPPHTLEKIFSYLSHRDRSRASAVCKTWADAYESPSLWRSPVFRFSKKIYSRPKFNPRHIVNRYGRFFRKLTILYKRSRCNSLKFISKQISEFLQAMTETKVQVKSIRMPRLMVLAESCPHQYSCEKMVEFLRCQTGLTHVDFTNGRTYQNPGMEVLESLVPENVQHLMLQNFFETQFSGITSSERYLTAMGRFCALRTLSLNYNYLSDQVMACLTASLSGHLETFSILCKQCGSLSNIISDKSWSCLKKKCPRMKVRFRLEIENLRTTYVINSNILSIVMPLESMQFRLSTIWNEEYDHPIFGYLADGFTNSLREVVFELEGVEELDVRIGIADLVCKCTMLESLTLRAHFQHFELRDLFQRILDALFQQMLETGTMSLKIFRATFRGLWPDRRRSAMYLQKIYTPKFKDMGVLLKLKIKK